MVSVQALCINLHHLLFNEELISTEMTFKIKSQNIKFSSIMTLFIHVKTVTTVKKGIMEYKKFFNILKQHYFFFSEKKLVQEKISVIPTLKKDRYKPF